MPEAAVQRVLVVGGGIAGGVLSLGLAQKGVEVVLVDLRDGLGGVGHGITLQGNALKAFQAVGIYDRLAERGFAFSHLRMKSPDGHVIMEIPTPPMGGPDLPGTMGALRGDRADILAVVGPVEQYPNDRAWRIRHRDGQWVSVEVVAAPRVDGPLAGHTALAIHDVTKWRGSPTRSSRGGRSPPRQELVAWRLCRFQAASECTRRR